MNARVKMLIERRKWELSHPQPAPPPPPPERLTFDSPALADLSLKDKLNALLAQPKPKRIDKYRYNGVVRARTVRAPKELATLLHTMLWRVEDSGRLTEEELTKSEDCRIQILPGDVTDTLPIRDAVFILLKYCTVFKRKELIRLYTGFREHRNLSRAFHQDFFEKFLFKIESMTCEGEESDQNKRS